MSTETPRVNVYWSLPEDVTQSLLNTNYMLVSLNDSLDFWSDSYRDVTNAWLYSNEDPDTGEESQAAIDVGNADSNEDLENIVNNDMGDPDEWSMSLNMKFLGLVGQYWEEGISPLLQSAGTTMGSIIQAKMASEQAEPQAQEQQATSLIGQAAQAGTPFSQMGTAVSDVMGGNASNVSQITA